MPENLWLRFNFVYPRSNSKTNSNRFRILNFSCSVSEKFSKNGTANAICDTGYRSKERPFKAWFNQPICGGKWVFYPWIEDKTFGKSSMSKVRNGCFLLIYVYYRTLKFPSGRKDLNLFLMEDLTSYFLFWNYSTKKFLRNTRVLLLKFC